MITFVVATLWSMRGALSSSLHAPHSKRDFIEMWKLFAHAVEQRLWLNEIVTLDFVVVVWNIVWIHSKSSLSCYFACGIVWFSSKFRWNFTRNFVSIDEAVAPGFKLTLHVGSLENFLVVAWMNRIHGLVMSSSFHGMSRLDCAISLSICELACCNWLRYLMPATPMDDAVNQKAIFTESNNKR